MFPDWAASEPGGASGVQLILPLTFKDPSTFPI